jgi:hypothetical protein
MKNDSELNIPEHSQTEFFRFYDYLLKLKASFSTYKKKILKQKREHITCLLASR